MLEKGYIYRRARSNKKGKAENYRNTIAIVPPLSQYYHNVGMTYCSTVAIVKISTIVTCSLYLMLLLLSGLIRER